MWVLKLGGSLCGSSSLHAWLARAAHGSRRVVVVPGGGPFADRVRVAQRRWRFDDRTAHGMALVAMEQMARLYCEMHPACSPAGTIREIEAVLAYGGVPVWLPRSMALADPSIETDWTMTSDSLALWLAYELSAAGVVLVKSCALPAAIARAEALQRQGVVDGCFSRYLQRLSCPVSLVERTAFASWPGLLDNLSSATVIRSAAEDSVTVGVAPVDADAVAAAGPLGKC